MTLFDDLEQYSDRCAIIDEGGKRYSYADLLKDGDHIAKAAGTRQLVLCVIQNGYPSITGYVGFLRAGLVPLLLNHTTSNEDIDAIIERFQPAFIFAPQDRVDYLHKAELLAQLDTHFLWRANNTTTSTTLNKDLALVLSTSGSTGGGTFVRLSQNNLTSNTQAILGYLPITAADTTITSMPMSYTYGLSVINTHLCAGATVVAAETSLVTSQFWDMVKSEKITNLNGVPFIYHMLQKLRFGKMDLPALKFLTQAGGKLAPALAQEFASICDRKGCALYIMYGQTEATARIAYLPPEKLARKPGSIGGPVPGGRLWLADEHGQPTTNPDVPGELIYEGPNVSLGTAQSAADLALGDDNNGILHTGDIAVQDEDGDFSIVGRKKRMLKLFGNRVNLDELEQKLADAGFIAACTGEDDAMRITLEGEHDTDKVRQWLLAHSSLPAKGFKVGHVRALPRTDAGKVRYQAVDNLAKAAS